MPSLYAPTGSDAERKGASSQRAYRKTKADFQGYMQANPNLSGEQAYAQWNAQRPRYGNQNDPFQGPSWDARIPGHAGQYAGSPVRYPWPDYAPGATVPWGVPQTRYDRFGNLAGPPSTSGPAPGPTTNPAPGPSASTGGQPPPTGATPPPAGGPRQMPPGWNTPSTSGPDQNWDWNASADPALYGQAGQWALGEAQKNVLRGQLNPANPFMNMLTQARQVRGMSPLVGNGYGMGLDQINTKSVQPWRVGDTSMGQSGADMYYAGPAGQAQRFQQLSQPQAATQPLMVSGGQEAMGGNPYAQLLSRMGGYGGGFGALRGMLGGYGGGGAMPPGYFAPQGGGMQALDPMQRAQNSQMFRAIPRDQREQFAALY